MKNSTKNKKITQKNKTVKQKAGVRISDNYNQYSAMKFFMENSTYSYFSKGRQGVLILATLNDNVNSPYKHIRMNGNERVSRLLFKFYELDTPTNTTINTPETIQNELSIHMDVYAKSLIHPKTLLEPICPGIVFSQTVSTPEPFKSKFKSLILRTIQEKYKSLIERMFTNEIAFIVMECMDGYVILESLEDDPKFEWYNTMAFYSLHKLHEIGYKHADYNRTNVLIHPTNTYFYMGSGQAIIIDFGMSRKLDEGEENDMIRLLRREEGMPRDKAEQIVRLFPKMENVRENIQSRYIHNMEQTLGTNIISIIENYVFYKYRQRGGKSIMTSRIPMTDIDNKNKTVIYKKNMNMTDIDNKNMTDNKKWDFISLDDFDKQISEQFRKEFQLIDPDGYKKYIDGLNSIVEENKKNPGYLKKIVEAQLDGMIDPNWKPISN